MEFRAQSANCAFFHMYRKGKKIPDCCSYDWESDVD